MSFWGRWIVLWLLVIGLAGCVAPRPVIPTPGPDTCGAADYQRLLGQPPRAADAMPQPKRVYHVTDRVTLGDRAGRINVVIDDTGTIGAIVCG